MALPRARRRRCRRAAFPGPREPARCWWWRAEARSSGRRRHGRWRKARRSAWERARSGCSVGGGRRSRRGIPCSLRAPRSSRRRGRAGRHRGGIRGRGMLGRMLLGSVSRQVVQAATCPVLVVKGRPDAGAPLHHRGGRVSQFATRGRGGGAPVRPSGGRVTLVSVIEPVRVPSGGLMPARVGGALRAEAERLTAERRRKLEGAQRQLRIRLLRAGWKVREVVRIGHAPGGVARRRRVPAGAMCSSSGPAAPAVSRGCCWAVSQKGS
jgi:nucleotide-binding universal stress UspA family protein